MSHIQNTIFPSVPLATVTYFFQRAYFKSISDGVDNHTIITTCFQFSFSDQCQQRSTQDIKKLNCVGARHLSIQAEGLISPAADIDSQAE